MRRPEGILSAFFVRSTEVEPDGFDTGKTVTGPDWLITSATNEQKQCHR
jgi:hypothetical protein